MSPSHVPISLLMPHNDDDDDYGKTIIIFFQHQRRLEILEYVHKKEIIFHDLVCFIHKKSF